MRCWPISGMFRLWPFTKFRNSLKSLSSVNFFDLFMTHAVSEPVFSDCRIRQSWRFLQFCDFDAFGSWYPLWSFNCPEVERNGLHGELWRARELFVVPVWVHDSPKASTDSNIYWIFHVHISCRICQNWWVLQHAILSFMRRSTFCAPPSMPMAKWTAPKSPESP